MNNQFDYQALGARIRKARKEQHLTQEQLAEACNLSAAHIGHIERGTRALSIESLISISETLDVSTDYLLMDVTHTHNKKLSSLMTALQSLNSKNSELLYSVFKILAENADKL